MSKQVLTGSENAHLSDIGILLAVL